MPVIPTITNDHLLVRRLLAMAFPPEVSILTESVVLETSESQYRSSRYQPHGTSFENIPCF